MGTLKSKIICWKIMIIGCLILISVYIIGFIGMFITPRIYFSDLEGSTIMVLLVIVILILIMQNLDEDLKKYIEDKKND